FHLLCWRMPVQDECDGRGCAFGVKVDKEPLAIRRHGVLLLDRANDWATGNANREQSRRCSGFQRLAIRRRLHWCCHHFTISGQVKDFFPILVPARSCAAVRGYLELPARSWKRLHVYFVPAGFVRLVSDPLAVGGELAIAFVKRRLQKREWL